MTTMTELPTACWKREPGLGTLACTIYSDADYTTVIDVSSVKVGDLIYWTTTDNRTRIWHHVGTVQATVPGYPNRS